MKLFVISDTHGMLGKAEEVYQRLKDVDLLVHLGDHRRDGEELAERFGLPSACVGGNCDGVRGRDAETVLKTEYGRIFLTHGHDYHVGYRYDDLLQRCRELDCRAAFFGHTHVPVVDEIDGIRLLNPGSLSLPRDGSDGSYAIVHAEPDRIETAVLYYRPQGEPPRKKPRGGFLRNLMNYSDGF
ncbi:MAG: metallophosphoesterase family protein [Anaerovoracaceae bacterium]|jgi:putative phosphoesterase